MVFISEVETVFEIHARGYIIAHRIPYDIQHNMPMGTEIEFHNPDRNIISARIAEVEMINRGKPMNHAPFIIQPDIPKTAIQIGSKVYKCV